MDPSPQQGWCRRRRPEGKGWQEQKPLCPSDIPWARGGSCSEPWRWAQGWAGVEQTMIGSMLRLPSGW